MKKINYFIFVAITIFVVGNASAQDKIFLKTGNTIEAKILEINQKDVKYKKFNNLEGPIYTKDKMEIYRVVYENGQSEIFNNEQKGASEKHTNNLFKKNRFEGSFGFVHYGVNSIREFESNGVISSISYERILNESGLLGLKFKGEMGYTEYEDTIVTFGVALNVYPFKNAKWLYAGPSIKFGRFLYYEFDEDDVYYIEYVSVPYFGLGFNLGSQFQINSLFGIRAGLEYNFIKFDNSNLGDMGEFLVQLGFNFSF